MKRPKNAIQNCSKVSRFLCPSEQGRRTEQLHIIYVILIACSLFPQTIPFLSASQFESLIHSGGDAVPACYHGNQIGKLSPQTPSCRWQARQSLTYNRC